MRPYIHVEKTSLIHVPYTIKISGRNDAIDQKRGLYELRPGYHVVLRVVANVVNTTNEFESFDVNDRNCKLPHETDGFHLLQNYTKDGCEFECALNFALNVCKCLPWYYPNNFTGAPMCDLFGAKCFDMIMSDEQHYKKCPEKCLENCKGVSYVAFPTSEQINLVDVCNQPILKDLIRQLQAQYRHITMFEHMTMQGKQNLFDDEWTNEFCQDYFRKYISIVSVETPTNTAVKSKRVQRTTFFDKLATVGGTLGLFSGLSILSMVEIICFCLKVNKHLCLSTRDKLCKKKQTEDVMIVAEKIIQRKDEEHADVEHFVAKIIQRATRVPNREDGNMSLVKND